MILRKRLDVFAVVLIFNVCSMVSASPHQQKDLSKKWPQYCTKQYFENVKIITSEYDNKDNINVKLFEETIGKKFILEAQPFVKIFYNFSGFADNEECYIKKPHPFGRGTLEEKCSEAFIKSLQDTIKNYGKQNNVQEVENIKTDEGDPVAFTLLMPENPKAIIINAYGGSDQKESFVSHPGEIPFSTKYMLSQGIGVMSLNLIDILENKSSQRNFDEGIFKRLLVSIKAARDWAYNKFQKPTYFLGTSFGGVISANLLAQYPGDFRGGMMFASALNEEECSGDYLKILKNGGIEKIKDNILFMHNTSDKNVKCHSAIQAIKEINKRYKGLASVFFFPFGEGEDLHVASNKILDRANLNGVIINFINKTIDNSYTFNPDISESRIKEFEFLKTASFDDLPMSRAACYRLYWNASNILYNNKNELSNINVISEKNQFIKDAFNAVQYNSDVYDYATFCKLATQSDSDAKSDGFKFSDENWNKIYGPIIISQLATDKYSYQNKMIFEFKFTENEIKSALEVLIEKIKELRKKEERLDIFQKDIQYNLEDINELKNIFFVGEDGKYKLKYDLRYGKTFTDQGEKLFEGLLFILLTNLHKRVEKITFKDIKINLKKNYNVIYNICFKKENIYKNLNVYFEKIKNTMHAQFVDSKDYSVEDLMNEFQNQEIVVDSLFSEKGGESTFKLDYTFINQIFSSEGRKNFVEYLLKPLLENMDGDFFDSLIFTSKELESLSSTFYIFNRLEKMTPIEQLFSKKFWQENGGFEDIFGFKEIKTPTQMQKEYYEQIQKGLGELMFSRASSKDNFMLDKEFWDYLSLEGKRRYRIMIKKKLKMDMSQEDLERVIYHTKFAVEDYINDRKKYIKNIFLKNNQTIKRTDK